jgi:hypothetical protein
MLAAFLPSQLVRAGFLLKKPVASFNAGQNAIFPLISLANIFLIAGQKHPDT